MTGGDDHDAIGDELNLLICLVGALRHYSLDLYARVIPKVGGVSASAVLACCDYLQPVRAAAVAYVDKRHVLLLSRSLYPSADLYSLPDGGRRVRKDRGHRGRGHRAGASNLADAPKNGPPVAGDSNTKHVHNLVGLRISDHSLLPTFGFKNEAVVLKLVDVDWLIWFLRCSHRHGHEHVKSPRSVKQFLLLQLENFFWVVVYVVVAVCSARAPPAPCRVALARVADVSIAFPLNVLTKPSFLGTDLI